MRLNNGNYSISVPTDIPEDIATTASTDPKAFRDFVVKHAKIEVL
jgi:hypothetical protein